MGRVPRSALTIAALAHAATPSLRPTGVSASVTAPGGLYEVVQVRDADGGSWTVRATGDPSAGAALESSAGLLRLLRSRVPFAVPAIAGTATGDDGTTVVVQPTLPGAPLVWHDLQAGSALARRVGAALAALHDVDPRVVEEAGLPTYDADGYRALRLAALDRAATTGHVPATLLTRWERALEEVTLWRFATCVTHGTLEGAHVLADDDAITAIDHWERAGVADPAEDFGALLALAPQDAFDTVLEAYAGARRDRPDVHLERRIRLSAELHRVTALLDAVAIGDESLIERRAVALERFAEDSADDDRLMPSPFARQRPAALPAEPVDPRDVESVDGDGLDGSDDDDTVEIPVGGAGATGASETTGDDDRPPASITGATRADLLSSQVDPDDSSPADRESSVDGETGAR